jgi:protein O-GlcNAc transferase
LEIQNLPFFDEFRQQSIAITQLAREQRRRSVEELHRRLKGGDLKSGTYIELARTLTQTGQLEAAASVLKEGLAVCESDEQLCREAIFTLEQANRTEEAIALARRAQESFPDLKCFRLWEALMLPVVYETETQIEYYRARYSTGLAEQIANLNLSDPGDRRAALDAVGRQLNFYLGYQGRDDRRLQEQYARFVHAVMAANYPDWVKPLAMPPVRSGEKIRVGFISAHFRDHSVTKLFSGWLRELDRREFEPFVYHNGKTVDAVTQEIRGMINHFRHIPGVFEPLCEAVRCDNLHVVVFLDVRHRRMAMMSAVRLAPVQCVAWAHPITSGSPMLDYYLSGDLMEPEDAQDHYTERLIRLPRLGVCYPKPIIPRPLLRMSRDDFGLEDDRIVFLCCQSIFKYLPRHDDLFVRIAKRLPSAQFVFLAFNEMVARDFLARLRQAFADEGLEASDYCVVLPQLSTFDYWNLNLVADVFLDSLEWSGGVTTLEAIACQLPIVTLPGRYMRGRHSYGILRQLGVSDTIAHDKDEYVEIAVRLGADREWRADVRNRMKDKHAQLYSDTNCVRALEDFFRSVVLSNRT